MHFLSRGSKLLRDQGDSSRPEVILHDPAAAGPQNLDDLFRNAELQERVGKLIAAAMARVETSPSGSAALETWPKFDLNSLSRKSLS